jgi:hypothetical protein
MKEMPIIMRKITANLWSTSAVHVLWWNESADSRAAGRHWSHEDPRVVAAGELID